MSERFWVMVGYTYRSKFKSVGFLVSTAIMGLAVVLLFFVPQIIQLVMERQAGDIQVIGVYDEAGLWPVLESLAAGQKGRQRLELLSAASATEAREIAEDKVADKEWVGLLTLQMGGEGIEAIYWAEKVQQLGPLLYLEPLLQQAHHALAAQELQLGQEQLQTLLTPVTIHEVSLDEGVKDEQELMMAAALVYILLFVLYVTILQYGAMVSTDVVTEKSSRVMEILVSSVPPIQQLAAKMLGVGLLALTQYAFLIALGWVGYSLSDPVLAVGNLTLNFREIPYDLVGFALLFFILGYLLYVSLMAALSAMVSRTEEASQVQTPAVLLVVAAFLLAMYGLNQPSSPVVAVTSYIPFFTPMVMFLRLGMGTASMAEVGLSLLILALTVLLVLWLASRFYRTGVFHYGGRLKWSELVKWLGSAQERGAAK